MKTATKSTQKGGTKRKTKKGDELSKPDLLWKDLASEFTEDFILFFFGKRLFNAIDFSVPPESLEQEFNEVFAANEPSKKIADKIMRLQLKNGKSKFIILHIEFQGSGEKLFRLRMFTYFMYIFFKYKTTDVTALAIYTGAGRPAIYDRFHAVHHGTEITYIFNTYTVKDQSEAELLKSNNPFAFAVLASLYLIKVGNDELKKLEIKKKLLNIALEKGFDYPKLYRLLNFVKYLVKLSKPLELVFDDYSKDAKKNEEMEKVVATREYLNTFSPFFEKAINEITEEARLEERKKVQQEIQEAEGKKTEAERKKREAERKKTEAERKKTILYFYKQLGLDAKQIVNITDIPVKFVEKTIDDYKKSLLKKE